MNVDRTLLPRPDAGYCVWYTLSLFASIFMHNSIHSSVPEMFAPKLMNDHKMDKAETEVTHSSRPALAIYSGIIWGTALPASLLYKLRDMRPTASQHTFSTLFIGNSIRFIFLPNLHSIPLHVATYS